MSSDDGDEDLALLRSVALASLRKKPSEYQTEDEDVDALRRQALTSRNNSETVIKTRNKSESSLDQLDSESESEKDDDHTQSASFDDETSSSNSSSHNEGEEISSTEDADHPVVRKDEDDLLSAIDQFLDEGVMLLEEAITPVKPTPKKNKKTKRKKPDKAKYSKDKRKVSVATKRERKSHENIDKFAAGNKPCVLPEENKFRDHTTDIKDSGFRRQPIVWESTDLPLDRNFTRKILQKGDCDAGSDSVHSSDLSFLADEDNHVKENPSATETLPSDSKSKFIIVNKNKLEQLRELRKTDDYSGLYDAEPVLPNKTISRRRIDSADYQKQGEGPACDLRDKLRRKGLHRSLSSEALASSDTTSNGRSTSENDRSKIQVNKGNKIFIKPSLVYGDRDANAACFNAISTAEDFSGLSVAREREENSVHLTNVTSSEEEGTVMLDKTSKRKRRSVVQFKPNISVHEKQKELKMIQEEVENQTKEADDDFSGLSEDFELDEPDESKSAKTVRIQSTDKNDTGKSPSPDDRRFISRIRVDRKRDKRKFDNSNVNEIKSKKTRTVIRETAVDPLDSRREHLRTRSKAISTSPASDDEADQKYRRGASSFQRHRRDVTAMPDGRTSVPLNCRLQWRSSRDDRQTKDRVSSFRNKVAHTRNRRADDAAVNRNSADESVEIFSNSRSVKERLGNNFSSRSQNEKRNKDDDVLRAEREKDVDARIRRIQEQNNQILKRRQLIEMEEKKFRLKVT